MDRIDRRRFLSILGAGAATLALGGAPGGAAGASALDVTYYFLPG